MSVTKQMVDELVELMKIAHEKIIKESGGEQGIRAKIATVEPYLKLAIQQNA